MGTVEGCFGPLTTAAFLSCRTGVPLASGGIDASAETVTLSTADGSIVADQNLRLADRSGTSAAAITAAAVASIDAGAANSVTLGTADASITAGQTLRLADAGGQSCGAAPKGSDLVVAWVNGAVVTFQDELTSGDASASTNCVITLSLIHI